MMVRSPYRADRYARGLGAGEPSWFAQWLSGFNDGGRILAFVAAQPDGGDVPTLARETGKTIVWRGGNGNIQGTPGPYLDFVNPDGGSGNLRLDQPRPGWFRSPGDDVMRAAIAKWVPYASTANASQGFSQAVPVLGGQTAEQAAAIRKMTAQVSPGAPVSDDSATSSGMKLPMWAWAMVAAAVAYAAFGGSK